MVETAKMIILYILYFSFSFFSFFLLTDTLYAVGRPVGHERETGAACGSHSQLLIAQEFREQDECHQGLFNIPHKIQTDLFSFQSKYISLYSF